MTWKVELTKPVEKRDGNVVATVKFSNGTESFIQEVPAHDLTPDSLGVFCQSIVEVREKRDESLAMFSNVQPGPIKLPRDS